MDLVFFIIATAWLTIYTKFWILWVFWIYISIRCIDKAMTFFQSKGWM